LPLKKIEKNINLNIPNNMYGNNNLPIFLEKKENKEKLISETLLLFEDWKNKKLEVLDKNKNKIKYKDFMKNLEKMITKIKFHTYLEEILINEKNYMENRIGYKKSIIERPIVKESNIKNKLNNKIIPIVPLVIYKPKKKTLADKFSDYKLLIQLNKEKNYRPLYTIRKYINNITNFNSKSAYSFSKNYNYNFNMSPTANNNKLTKNLYSFLESSFFSMYYLISKPIFIITPEKVVIHLFCYNFLMLKKKIKKNILIEGKNISYTKII
jgi:hypothetical protein